MIAVMFGGESGVEVVVEIIFSGDFVKDVVHERRIESISRHVLVGSGEPLDGVVADGVVYAHPDYPCSVVDYEIVAIQDVGERASFSDFWFEFQDHLI